MLKWTHGAVEGHSESKCLIFLVPSLTHTSWSHVLCNTSHTCCISALWLKINKEVWDRERFTAHLQRAEWWLAGWKSIVGGKTPSKLSMGLTSRYCRQDSFHKAVVSLGTKADTGGSSLISIRAMNYKGPLCGDGNCTKSNRGCVSGGKEASWCLVAAC